MNTNLISVMCDCSLPSFLSSPLCAGHGQRAQSAQCPNSPYNTSIFFSLQFWLPEDKIQLRCTLSFPIFERKSCYVAHTNLNLIILLTPVPKCWGYRCAPIPFPTLFSSQTRLCQPRLCFSHRFFLSYVYCHGRRQAMAEPHVAFSKTFLYTAFYFLVVLLWYKS